MFQKFYVLHVDIRYMEGKEVKEEKGGKDKTAVPSLPSFSSLPSIEQLYKDFRKVKYED